MCDEASGPEENPPAREVVVLNEDGLVMLAGRVLAAAARIVRPGQRRYMLGITGVGGSGKSTLAARLAAEIEARQPGSVQVIGMDGFHWPNAVLAARGLSDQKGGPLTFDVAAFTRVLRAARGGVSPLTIPVYDRQTHEPLWSMDAPDGAARAVELRKSTNIVVVEGNYLLFDKPPWRDVAASLDACWYLDTPAKQVRDWLIARHVAGGRSYEQARAWYERVDRANARKIMASQSRATLYVAWRGG